MNGTNEEMPGQETTKKQSNIYIWPRNLINSGLKLTFIIDIFKIGTLAYALFG